MLTRPDATQCKALARLVRSPEGEVLLSVLDTELRRLQTNLLDSSGDVTVKLQGRASEVHELIELLRVMPSVAEKTR